MPTLNSKISFFGLGASYVSSLLYSYIKEHPEAYIADTETRFFSDTTQYARGLAWYEAHFSGAKPGQLCGELASDYLASAQAAGIIARTYPSARLCAVLENPLVSVRVEYIEALQHGRVRRGTPLSVFLKQNPEVLLRARYARQLVHYFSFYSHTDCLVLLAEDIRKEPLTVVGNTYTHLGLSPKFVPLALRHLVVEEEEDTKKRPGIIKRTIKAIKKLIKKLITTISQKLNPPKIPAETTVQKALRVPLSPEEKAGLIAYYAADVAQLSSLLHRNLTVEWGFEVTP